MEWALLELKASFVGNIPSVSYLFVVSFGYYLIVINFAFCLSLCLLPFVFLIFSFFAFN